MKKSLVILGSIGLVGFILYSIIAYNATTSYSNFQVRVEEKHKKDSEYFVNFRDEIYDQYLEFEVDQNVWNLLTVGEEYVISFGFNQLFKTPALEEIIKAEVPSNY